MKNLLGQILLDTYSNSFGSLEMPQKIEREVLISNVQRHFADKIEINVANVTWKGLENATHYVFLPYVIYKTMAWLYGQSGHPSKNATDPQAASAPKQEPGYKTKLAQLMISEGLSELIRSKWGQMAIWEMYKTDATSFLRPIVGWFLETDAQIPLVDPLTGIATGITSDLLQITSGDAKNAAYQMGAQVVGYMNDPAKLVEVLMSLLPESSSLYDGAVNLTTGMMGSAVNGTHQFMQSSAESLKAGGYSLLQSAKEGSYSLVHSVAAGSYGLLQSAVSATFAPVVNTVDDSVWKGSRYVEEKTGFVSAETIHNSVCGIAGTLMALYALRVIAARIDYHLMPPNTRPVVNQYTTHTTNTTMVAPTTPASTPTKKSYWDYVPSSSSLLKKFSFK